MENGNFSTLNFGTSSEVINTSISLEIKKRLKLIGDKGVCRLAEISQADVSDDDGVVSGKKFSMVFHAIDTAGGGCSKTISTKSPSIFSSSINKLKYLFNATGHTLPESAENPVLVANESVDAELFAQVRATLIAYQTKLQRLLTPEEMIINNGTVVIQSKALFSEIFKGTGIQYIYSDLDAVNATRIAHNKQRRGLEGKELETCVEEYRDYLNSAKVLPCKVNMTVFTDVFAGLQAIKDSGNSVYIEAKNYGSTANSYSAPKA